MSIFLSVLLFILKFIGILFLSIIGFILFCVIIILFVPVRYKAKVDVVDKDINFLAKGSWLFHIVSVSYNLGAVNPLNIRIFGHALKFNKGLKQKNNSSKSNKKEIVKKDKAKKRKNTKSHDVLKESSEDKVSNITENIEPKIEQSTKDISNEDISIEDFAQCTAENNLKDVNQSDNIIDLGIENSKKIEAVSKEIMKDDEDLLDDMLNEDLANDSTKSKKDNKTSDKYDKIKGKIELIKSDSFKQAFLLCKKELIHIFKIVLPKKWYIDAKLGFDDPATTGKILAISGMFYGLIHKHISLVGDFENEIIDVHGKFIGHITAFRLLCVAAHLYFNKNLKSIINQIREA